MIKHFGCFNLNSRAEFKVHSSAAEAKLFSTLDEFELSSTTKDACFTHWGRVTHICVGNLTIIGSDNGLSPGRRQTITWTNAGILLIGPLGTNFGEMLIEIHTFSFKKIHLEMSSRKWRPFCLGLNVLMHMQWTSQLWRVCQDTGNVESAENCSLPWAHSRATNSWLWLFYSLQIDDMSVTTSRITSNSTVCWTVCWC